MWAIPFFKFNTYNIILCCYQWTMKYDIFEKYFNSILKMSNLKVLICYLTNYTDVDSINFLAPCH